MKPATVNEEKPKPYSCDNSYDEVMRMLPESTVPAPADVRHIHSPWGDDDADDILASDTEEVR